MKHEPIRSQLWAVVVSFALSFGGVSAMVTAFSLEESLTALVFGCVLLAVLAAFLMRYRFGWLGYYALLALMLLMKKFWLQGKYLCLQITQFYSAGYGFQLPSWMLDVKPQPMLLPLLLIAGIVTGVAVGTILHRRRAFWAVGIGLLPLISCLIVTVTVPDTFAIVFLLGALALLIMTQSTRRQDPRQGNRLCAMLALPIVAGLLLLMAVVPRESYRPFRLPGWMSFQNTQTVPNAPSDVSDKRNSAVDLSQEGYRKLDRTPVMDITTDFAGKLYLRGRHYHTYTGTAWDCDLSLPESSITPSDTWVSTANYSVTISPRKAADYHHIPYYTHTPQSFYGGMIPIQADGVYTYEFSPLWSNWRQRWQKLPGSMPQEEADYLYLPSQTVDWAAELATRLLGSTDPDAVSIAEAVKEYVRNSADYDLDTPIPPEDTTDFVRWFLTDSDTGYCVHFASAATGLLRAAGVPARYVEGYTLQVSSPEETVVREEMAHAWVEYYVGGLGWVILDPTPADTEESTPPVTTVPTEPATTPTTQPTTTAPATTEPTAPSATPDPEPVTPRRFTGLVWVLTGSAAGLLLLLTQWLTRRRWKLRKLRRGHPNRQALARYDEVKLLSKLQRLPVPDELRNLAEKAKFSNHPLTRQELAQFDKYTAESIRSLCEAHWYWHILLRLVFALC